MSGYYIFKFEKVLLIVRKVVMFFSFLIKKEAFSGKNSAVLNNTGEKANLHSENDKISKNYSRYLKKLNSILFLFFITITVPNLNIFGAATASQYNADHKKNSKKSQFYFSVSLCYHTQKKACFKIHFLP